MIRFVKMECPSCGGKLKKRRGNLYTCPYCNNDYIMDKEILILVDNAPKPADNDLGKRMALFIIAVMILFGVGIFVFTRQEEQTVSPNVSYQVTRARFTDELLLEFLEKVYGKNGNELSEEELGRITAFGVHDGKVSYSIDNGELIYLEDIQSRMRYTEELNNFKNLETLDIPYFSLDKSSLQGMDKLKYLYCSSSPSLIGNSLPHPEELKGLKCYIRESDEAEGIAKFVNLGSLDVEFNSDVASLDKGFSELTKLESLKIKSRTISNLSGFSSAKDIKELEVDCGGIKSIDFIEDMDKLEAVKIARSEIASAEPLRGKNLKKLEFHGSSNVMDYSFVSDMAELEELSLSIGKEEILPSLEKLTKVHTFDISGLDDFDNISCMTGLKRLSIKFSDRMDFASISKLQNLEYFKINSGYSSMLFMKNLDALTELTNLTVVDFGSVKNYEGTIDCLFNIPGIKELYLNDSFGEIDYDRIEVNETLEILNLSDADIKKDIYYETNGWMTDVWYDPNPICDHIDMISKFPNLKELYLEDQKLTDIEFVKDLPNLEILDITDNNITDITPLKELKNFKRIDCADNAISKGMELRDSFEINEEAKEDDIWSINF